MPKIATKPIYQPPVTPPPPPPQPPLSRDQQYVKDAMDIVAGWVENEDYTEKQADEYLDSLAKAVRMFGVQSDTPLFSTIMGQWKARDAAQQAAQEAQQAQLQQQTEQAVKNLMVSQEKQYSSQWNEFNTAYQDILSGEMTPDQKQGALLNEINRLGTKVQLDPLANFHLQQKAVNDAFNLLPGGEQDLRRLRAQYPQAEQYFQPKVEQSANYQGVFEQFAGGTGGSQPWLNWFQSNYPSLMSQFKAASPIEGKTPAVQEANWSTWLNKRVSKLKEEYASMSPYSKGQRPGAYAPMLRTVKF